MRRPFQWVIPLLLAVHGAFADDANPSTAVWSLAIHGGGGCDSTYGAFYRDLQYYDHKMKDFGVPAKRRISLFGIEKDGQYTLCTNELQGVSPPAEVVQSQNTHQEQVETQKQALFKQFLDAPPENRCPLARPIFKLLLEDEPGWHVDERSFEATFHHSMKDLDGKGSMISGPASPSKVESEFSHLEQAMNPGDQLFLDLNDHGILLDSSVPPDLWKKIGVQYQPGKKTYAMSLGSSGQALTMEQLNRYLQPMLARGVTVHVDVDTCFSGGFQALSRFTTPGICVTSMTDQSHVGIGERESYVKSEKSQLKSFACNLVSHGLNYPETSLDEIVEQWEKRSKATASLINVQCPTPQEDLKNIASAITRLRDQIGGDSLRGELIRLFESEYVQSYKACLDAENGAFDQVYWNATLTPQKTMFSMVRPCIDDRTLNLSPTEKYVLNLIMRNEFSEGEFAGASDQHYPAEQIARQLNFLRTADEDSLKKYKAAFCCLDYDPKTRSAPSLCEK